MAATTAPARRALWRNRDFVLLWVGQTVSVFGSRVSATAVPLLVLAMTHSPGVAGVVGFVGMLPHLLVQLPAGALVDRWNRWRVMLGCDLGRLLVVASLPVAWWLGALTVAQVAIVFFVETTLLVFFNLAEGAALPRLVSAAALPDALASNEAKTRGAALAGQPLGGLLFGIGRALPFVADVVSYALSTVALLLMRNRDLADPDPAPRAPLRQEIAAGARWLARQPFLRTSTLLVAGSNLIFQGVVLSVIVLTGERGASPAVIGLVLGFWGAGGLLGSLTAPWLRRLVAPRWVVIGVNWMWLVLLPLLLLPEQPLLIGVIGGLMAFVGPVWNVVIGAYILTLVPGHLLGRVRSAGLLLSWGAIPLGSLAGGLLLEWYGPAGAIWALSGLMALLAIAGTASPALRHAAPLPE